MTSLGATGELLDILVACSGRIPLFSLVLGTVSGVSALAAGLSDFVILGSDHGKMFMRSPYMIPEIIEGVVDEDSLGARSNMLAGAVLLAWLLMTSKTHSTS